MYRWGVGGEGWSHTEDWKDREVGYSYGGKGEEKRMGEGRAMEVQGRDAD